MPPEPDVDDSDLSALTAALPRRLRQALGAYAALRTGLGAYRRVKNWTTERLAYRVVVEGTDPIYERLHAWLLDNLPDDRHRTLTARTGSGSGPGPSDDSEPTGAPQPRVRLLYRGDRPSTVTIDGHKVVVAIERSAFDRFKSDSDQARRFIQQDETAIFTAQSVAGRDAVVDLLRRLDVESQRSDQRLLYRTAGQWGGWNHHAGVARRSLDSVHLPAGVLDDLVDDLGRFLDAEPHYADLGLPWHRGYLFSGPPGTGKTTTARALASHFGLGLYSLNLSSLPGDANLDQLAADVRPRSLLLIEDIDVAHASRVRDDDRRGVTLTGLLNALDGVGTPDGLVTVMTSNRADVLDPALVRPGRVDRRVTFDYMTTPQLRAMVRRTLGLSCDLEAPMCLTPAAVAEVLKRHLGGDPHEALVDLKGHLAALHGAPSSNGSTPGLSRSIWAT